MRIITISVYVGPELVMKLLSFKSFLTGHDVDNIPKIYVIVSQTLKSEHLQPRECPPYLVRAGAIHN